VSPLLLFVGFVAVGGFVALDLMANRLVRPVPREADRKVPDLGVDHEDLTIRSGDDDLGAWLLKPPGEPRKPLLLLAHGWGANYGPLLHVAEPMIEAGYEVLLFDVRGHGRNEAAPYVTVRHFRDGLLAVSAYVEERFPGRPQVMIGHSLGGAAAVLAAAEGAAVEGLVIIAAPSDVMRVTAEYLSAQGLPGTLLVAAFRPFWWRRIGGTFGPLTPSRRIGELEVPLLIIQPENDQRVARAHAERLAEAAGQPYQLMRDCGHTDVLGHEETHRLILEFLEGL